MRTSRPVQFSRVMEAGVPEIEFGGNPISMACHCKLPAPATIPENTKNNVKQSDKNFCLYAIIDRHDSALSCKGAGLACKGFPTITVAIVLLGYP